MKIRKTVGIDLGTTNSVIALLDPTDSALITGVEEHGLPTVPSVVAMHPEQKRVVVGRSAIALRGQGTQEPVTSVKRHLGLERTFCVGENNLTPVEVSAQILCRCREALASVVADPRLLIDSAIITMPAYFNHNQIEDTRRAGERAGFEVVELLHEPTAAAIYYSWIENHGDATYLVYDLGGGTFDVSLIRRRFGDYEVLSVSGDPFLGGDDFDRLLATHLQERVVQAHPGPINFDRATPDGLARFLRLQYLAEQIKIELSSQERVERHLDEVVRDEHGQPVSLHAAIDRETFHALIKDKIHRTIECCHQALALARQKCGLKLSDIDHVILVGGSSRIPLVRETIQAAFCKSELPEHVRSPQPLLHEPDLCVAYGAALRAATHGTRYIFPVARRVEGLLPDLDLDLGPSEQGLDLELHWTSPVNVTATPYTLTGCVRGPGVSEVRHGGLVRVRSFATGLTEEGYFDPQGAFALEMELQPNTDNALELIVCDNLGQELVRIPACVRHREQRATASLGLGVLPTQLLTKPLAIEVLNRNRRRVKQILAPVGAALPATFVATCRTVDQAGRIVVPIFEENRIIKVMEITGLDVRLPVGSPVDVEFHIDVKHNIEVKIRVREAGRTERAIIQGPPPPAAPSRSEVDQLRTAIEEALQPLSGGVRTRFKARLSQLTQDLYEALYYEDEPRAIQRLAELRDLHQQVERESDQVLDPPWPRFAQLVARCHELVEELVENTGRKREELTEPIHGHEHLAEQAYKEKNQPLYRECWNTLQKYASSLEDLRRATSRGDDEEFEEASSRSPEEDARAEIDRFRHYLSAVWKQAHARGRRDLDERLGQIAKQGQGLAQKAKEDPHAVLREARRLNTELAKVENLLRSRRPTSAGDDSAGLLEGIL